MSEVVIQVMVDVLSGLYADSLEGHVYGFDTNRPYGSEGMGGAQLATVVRPGDQIFWTPVTLECEAAIELAGIDFENSECIVEAHTAHGRRYLTMTVPDISKPEAYTMHFAVGRNGRTMSYPSGFTIRPMEEAHD